MGQLKQRTTGVNPRDVGPALRCNASQLPHFLVFLSSSVHRATTPSHQVRLSGVFCCRPDSLELAARLSSWSISQRRHL